MIPTSLFGRTTLANRFFQISECFDVKERTDYRKKEMVEPHRFVNRQGLKEGFVEQSNRSHALIVTANLRVRNPVLLLRRVAYRAAVSY